MLNIAATILFVLALPAPDSTGKGGMPENLSDSSLPYVIFPYDTTWRNNFPRTDGSAFQPCSLSKAEIDTCYRLMAARIEEWNKENPHRIINPAEYYFQYMPALSPKGNKMVLINSVCQSAANHFIAVREANWRKKLIAVEDGGRCFFRLSIDLKRMHVLRLSVNGPN